MLQTGEAHTGFDCALRRENIMSKRYRISEKLCKTYRETGRMLKLASQSGCYRRCWLLDGGMASDAEVGDSPRQSLRNCKEMTDVSDGRVKCPDPARRPEERLQSTSAGLLDGN